MRYVQHYEGEWIAPRRKRWFMKCCECGLTHIVNFRLVGKQIQMQLFRNEKMPFKSKAQIGKLAILEKQGKLPKGTVKKWAKETPNIKKLPKKLKKKG